MTSLLKNNAIFLHIPKTGGSWISHVLNSLNLTRARVGYPHADWHRAYWHDRFARDGKVFRCLLRRMVGIKRDVIRPDPNCFKFCFVREPLKWYESYWRFMESRGWPSSGDSRHLIHFHPDTLLSGLGSSDFNTFMDNVNRTRPGFVTEMYGWYVRPGIDFVGRQEKLVEDLLRVFKIMNLAVSPDRVRAIGPHNETSDRVAKPVWDPKLKAETLRLEYAGYARFGYAVDETLWENRPHLASLKAA
jgi:hypothetical protein